MKKLTKKQKEVAEKYDFKVAYSLEEGIKLIKESSRSTFDGSVDIAVNLGIDPKKPEQMIRNVVALPHGTGKIPSVLVLCTPEKEAEAKEAGADYVGFDEYLTKIEKGWTDVDVVITMPSLMAKVGRYGKVLGPKGLMPNPKTGTVTPEVGRAVKEIKAGKVTARTDKTGIVHSSVGRISFSVEQLKENIEVFIGTIKSFKHNTVKGEYLCKVSISSTMGRGVEILKNSIITR